MILIGCQCFRCPSNCSECDPNVIATVVVVVIVVVVVWTLSSTLVGTIFKLTVAVFGVDGPLDTAS